jgi:hypothetical protein
MAPLTVAGILQELEDIVGDQLQVPGGPAKLVLVLLLGSQVPRCWREESGLQRGSAASRPPCPPRTPHTRLHCLPPHPHRW